MPVPRRAVLRIVVIGVVSAVIVALAGWVAQRARLGATEADSRMRVEQDVRESFDMMVRRLSAMADAMAQPQRVRAAAAEETGATRELFAAARQVVGVDGAVTVYDADSTPLAWAGRPSELSAEILSGGETWMLASSGPGVRLAYVRPVMDGGTRLGSIAAEQLIAASDSAFSGVPGPRRARVTPFILPTPLAPVSVRPASDAPLTQSTAHTFSIDAPSGEPLVSVSMTPADLEATRQRWRRMTWSVVLFVLAATCLLLAGPLLDWRNRAAEPLMYVEATAMIAAVIVLARAVLRLASPADWSDSPLFSSAAYASDLFRPLLSSPFDFLVTAAAAGGLIGLLLFAVERWRLHSWRNRRWVTTPARRATYLLVQVAAGAATAAIAVGHRELLRNTNANTRLDLLDFSLHEWDPSRLALQVGLIVAHAAAIGLGVTTLRAAQVGWRVPRGDWHLRAMAIACWSLPLVLWRLSADAIPTLLLPLGVALTVIILLALYATRLVGRFRHGSQAFRLTLLTLGLVAPAFAFYPTIFQLAWDAKSQLVETEFAPEARNQLDNVQAQLSQSQMQIDQLPNLEALVTTPVGEDETIADRAFQVWQATALGSSPVTSSIEIYGPDQRLVSRFAFNLSEEPTTDPLPPETQCVWNTYAVHLPFFAEERTIIHAGRALCGADPDKSLGSIVLHVHPNDYENLEFIASRNPYVELLRAPERARGEDLAERDVEYAVYGWSRTPLYASAGPAWPLTDDVFVRVRESREPIWVELRRGSDAFDVYLTNDRFGIRALGFPAVSRLDHLVHLAELTVLAALTFLLLLVGNAVFGLSARRAATGPALLREIRASFYRKLFIAFVAAVFLPVVALAIVTRLYFADRIRTSIEQEAVDTAETAGRVVADLVALDDNLMVWVSRLIDHDVNLFSDGQLLATSERNLFASGLLPTRTPADIHDALLLRREAAIVTRERIGSLPEYLVAGTPLLGDILLTVPLTARQQQIEDEIETLDGRVLLGALLFMLAGAGLGYSMAERISDPVNRLTRATRRIARGDLDARVAATSSDELRRLVEDFNTMARDLKRQRAELERTNRLEAWAEMARQVAHEIKNPLTPIQLNAEHLRRVHADRGQPLGPILAECVETILTQVKLLRQIASEFSSFASSPTARPSSVDVPELLHEVVDPYRVGLADRIRFDLDVPDRLPPVHVDRSLISRSLTNIVENALHAMPGDGTLSVMARAENQHVRIRVADTGAGMDAEALARAFEPYFSTKASGTGLGLPIAKRNVELMGGTISVTSERDRGTTVELTLPLAGRS